MSAAAVPAPLRKAEGCSLRGLNHWNKLPPGGICTGSTKISIRITVRTVSVGLGVYYSSFTYGLEGHSIAKTTSRNVCLLKTVPNIQWTYRVRRVLRLESNEQSAPRFK